MKIIDIYRKYAIMPSLQLHMLRVGAVAATICDHFSGPSIDKSSIVATALLHDMGNILKFDLKRFPEFLEPKGMTFWESVKANYQERFGENEHVATELILEEINVIDRVKELKQAVEYNLACQNAADDDFGKKICAYSDMRVDPHGIVFLSERLEDLKKRYMKTSDSTAESFAREERHQKLDACLHRLEEQIFSYTDLSPADITNQELDGTINSLKNFVVPTVHASK